MPKTPSTKAATRRFLTPLICAAGMLGIEAQAQVVTQNTPFVPRMARDITWASPIDMQRCKSDYPRASRLNEEQGNVMIGLTVDANGDMSNLHLARSSGFRNLDRATINGLTGCLFRPMVIDGKAYRVNMNMVYMWRLSE